MLVLDRLSKLYNAGGGGLAEATVTLEAGRFFTLLGPSGCGKTTTLRCIAGLEEPTGGVIQVGKTVFYDGQRGINVPVNRRRIGMVFQSYAIWPHLSVFDNVAFPLRVSRAARSSRDQLHAKVERALDTVGLGGLGGRPATALSGGQQQRVALARAVVTEPSLLLLDEPLSNLDAALREEMRTELKRLQRTLGLTTVYVTHDQAEALEMSDVIAVMQRGRIAQLGTPRQIYFEPCNLFVAGFVGGANWLQGLAAGTDCGRAAVQLADGTVLGCRDPEGVAAPRPGAAVVWAIRPEALRLSPAGAAVQPGEAILLGQVRSVGFLGSATRIQVATNAGTLSVLGSGRADCSPGDGVRLAFATTDAIRLADAGQEQQ